MSLSRSIRTSQMTLVLACCATAAGATLDISADGRYFTIDGTPVFLGGVSYYGAQSITTGSLRSQDLADMIADGFNWIRVWAFWKTPSGEDVSVLTHNGQIREPYLGRLKSLIAECDGLGMVVDVSLARDAAGSSVGARSQPEHLACVQVLAQQLLAYRNVYIDVANERDVQDGRYVSLPECGQLISAIHAVDPARKCTASGVPQSQGELADFRSVGGLQFIAPHLCRGPECPAQTVSTLNTYSGWMANLGWRMPIQLQEPFRRGYSTTYEPVEDDYLRDCNGGKLAGAAGWCLHNGSNPGGSPPYRSFQMNDASGRLYAQLDSTEINVTNHLAPHIGGNDLSLLRYQPEYDEQLARQAGVGRREGTTRSANISQDKAGYLSYGPYITRLPADDYQVTWRLAIDDVAADNSAVTTIDVYCIDTNTVLASRAITRQQFERANVMQDFALTFRYATPGKRLEWRTYYHDNSYLRLDQIQVQALKTPAAPVICEVVPDPETARAGIPYIRELQLAAGCPAPAWSIVQGPAGLQVNGAGKVFGWVPAPGQVGQTVTITIRATNPQGYDDESWQVTVQNAPVPVLEDPLSDPGRTSGRFGGGTFSSAGYLLTASGYTSPAGEPQSRDFVYYNLDGAGKDGTGTIEVDVRGLFPDDGLEKTQVLTVCDRSGCCDAGVNPCNPATNGWAIYGSNYYGYLRKINYPDAPEYTDRMKLTAGVPGGGAEPCGGIEQFMASAIPWDGAATYRFRMTWTGNRVRYYRGTPGQTLSLLADYALSQAWTPAALHVQVGASSIAQIVTDIGGSPGTLYSLVRVYEEDLADQPTPLRDSVAPLICEVSPDPAIAVAGAEYIRMLSLCGGSAVSTWSIVAAPPGTVIDGNGRLHGWVPGQGDLGQRFHMSIQGANTAGWDVENWEVRVLSRVDLDTDGDVDQEDFGLIQACLSGEGYVYWGGCGPADFDADGDVDQTDVAAFRQASSGPGQTPAG